MQTCLFGEIQDGSLCTFVFKSTKVTPYLTGLELWLGEGCPILATFLPGCFWWSARP